MRNQSGSWLRPRRGQHGVCAPPSGLCSEGRGSGSAQDGGMASGSETLRTRGQCPSHARQEPALLPHRACTGLAVRADEGSPGPPTVTEATPLATAARLYEGLRTVHHGALNGHTRVLATPAPRAPGGPGGGHTQLRAQGPELWKDLGRPGVRGCAVVTGGGSVCTRKFFFPLSWGEAA